MHDELVRRPAGLPGRGLFEEVTADGFRPPLDDPPGGLRCQAGRLPEIFLSPDVPLGPVSPKEQDVAGPERLARGLQPLIRLLEGDLVYGLTALDSVEGGFHVRSGVQAHQVKLCGLPVPCSVLRPDVHLHPEIRRGWSLEAMRDRRTEVYDLHGDPLSC